METTEDGSLILPVDGVTVFLNEFGELSTLDPAKKDPTDSPGEKYLSAGSMDAGYFGEVPSAELFTGEEIAANYGITEGLLQFNEVGWLKFAIDGKIIFKSKKPIRHSISWDAINNAGCVSGSKTVIKDGKEYQVRLLKAANLDIVSKDSGDVNHGSEWNRLMLPIHIRSQDGSWLKPSNVETGIPCWGIDFTDEDLHTHTTYGNGSASWCQNKYNQYPMHRGREGVSDSGATTSDNKNLFSGWSPVLEVLQEV